MVEGARLESVCSSNVTAGSNPVLSAKLKSDLLGRILIWLRFQDPNLRLLKSKKRRR